MADVTVDRLVVLIEAQTRSFETQIRKLEGDINKSSRRMATAFGVFDRQLSKIGQNVGRVFGIGGLGRGGLIGSMIALGYGVNRAANAMGNLRKEAEEVGIVLDEKIIRSAETFNMSWDAAWKAWKINTLAALNGAFPTLNEYLKAMKGVMRPGSPSAPTQVVNRSAKDDLLKIEHDFTEWEKADLIIEKLTEQFEKLKEASNEAAQGITDNFRDLTFSIVDDISSWEDALLNMLRNIEKQLLDSILFGGGPFAQLFGTQGQGGAPGGLFGGLISQLAGSAAPYTTGFATAGGSRASAAAVASPAGPTAPIIPVSGGPVAGNYGALIQEAAAKYGLDPKVLSALIQAESGFNPNAIGPMTRFGQAQGLTQLLPGTAADLGVTNPLDPRQNIFGGANYLSQQMAKYGDLKTALAAYNWGPGNVDDYGMGKAPTETLEYIAKIFGILGMARGGPVSPGRPYMVGEQGPEMFVPRAPGTIVPGSMGGGGLRVNVINNNGSQVGVSQRQGSSGPELELLIDHRVDARMAKTLPGVYGIGPRRTNRM